MYFQNNLAAYLQIIEYPCLLSAPQLLILKDLYEFNVLIKTIDLGLEQYVGEYPDKVISARLLPFTRRGEQGKRLVEDHNAVQQVLKFRTRSRLFVNFTQFTNRLVPELRVVGVEPLTRDVKSFRPRILEHLLLHRLELGLRPAHALRIRKELLIQAVGDVVIDLLYVIIDQRLVEGHAAPHAALSHVSTLVYVECVSDEVTVSGVAGAEFELTWINPLSENWVLLHLLENDILELEEHVSESTVIVIFFAEDLVDDG